jgi:hypothetical protein
MTFDRRFRSMLPTGTPALQSAALSPPRRAAGCRTLARRTLLALVALTALASATAQAYTPPKGTPDLSKMTLQPSDLAPGAQPLINSYFDPGSGLHLRAEYDRDWGAASTTGGVKLEQLQTQVTLATSTKWAQAVAAQVPSIYGSNAGRSDLLADIVMPNGSVATLKDARFAKPRSIGVGQQSYYESATVTTKGSTIAVGFAWTRVGAGMAFLVVVAPKPPLADSVTITLAKTVAAHMASVAGG